MSYYHILSLNNTFLKSKSICFIVKNTIDTICSEKIEIGRSTYSQLFFTDDFSLGIVCCVANIASLTRKKKRTTFYLLINIKFRLQIKAATSSSYSKF